MSERTGKRPDRPEDQREILRVTLGSRAYGTANEKSDIDERVVFMVPTESFFLVDRRGDSKVDRTLWVEDKHKDLTGWELGAFIKLCLHCSPTALELLWVSDFSGTWEGEALRGVRDAFLSRQRVYDAFSGYAKNQRTKMFEQPEVGWTRRNWKFAEAYVRVLYQGYVLLKEGRLPVNLAEEEPQLRDYLLQVKAGKVQAGAVIDMARATEDRLLSALRSSELSDEPNLGQVNEMIRNVRKLT